MTDNRLVKKASEQFLYLKTYYGLIMLNYS